MDTETLLLGELCFLTTTISRWCGEFDDELDDDPVGSVENVLVGDNPLEDESLEAKGTNCDTEVII